MEKSVLKSKTFWFGLVSALLPLIPAVKEYVGANLENLAMVWGALVIVLRLVTKDKVQLLP